MDTAVHQRSGALLVYAVMYIHGPAAGSLVAVGVALAGDRRASAAAPARGAPARLRGVRIAGELLVLIGRTSGKEVTRIKGYGVRDRIGSAPDIFTGTPASEDGSHLLQRSSA